MSDIYKAPESDLKSPVDTGQYGSVERGVAGDYEFSIREVVKEGWEKTSGRKWTFHLAFLLYFLVTIAVMVVAQLALVPVIGSGEADPTIAFIAVFGQQIVINLIMLPLWAGLFILGIRASVDAPIEASGIFGHFGRALALFGTFVLMYLMIAIGLVLLVLPGIYLMFAYMMAMPLVVEKGMGPWEALETSRKTVTHHWFRMLGFIILMMIIFLLSSMLFMIPLIWTLPMTMIASGVIYRNMFGVEAATLE